MRTNLNTSVGKIPLTDYLALGLDSKALNSFSVMPSLVL